MNTITVKVGKVPGSAMIPVTLFDNATAADAINAAELDSNGFQIRVDNCAANADTYLRDGSRVTLVRQVKSAAADFITVTVSRVPGRPVEVTLNGDRTAGAAIDLAELDSEGYQIRLNGDVIDRNTSVSNGARIHLVRQTKSA